MSIEQWGVLALFTLLPLLEGVARLRQKRSDHSQNGTGQVVGQAPMSQVAMRQPPSPPAPLPKPASEPAISVSALPASHAPPLPRESGASEAHWRVQRPSRSKEVVQWLRPVRNLRRAIVMATILGPPSR